MGLFGGDAPQLNLPEVPTLLSGSQARQTALDFGESVTPLALGARESALADLLTPESTQRFFEGFQPTSFEQALAQQSFANVIPDVERSIKQNLSLSGIESSPVLAQQIGEARGQLGVDIGQILANLGQQRGVGSLNARLGIDPISQIIGPVSGQDISQQNLQDQLQFERDLAQALVDFQGEQQQQAKQSGLGALGGSLLGGGAGFFLGGPGGAALGASLGGSAGGALFGSGNAQTPLSLGDALSIGEVFGSGQKTTLNAARPSSVFAPQQPRQPVTQPNLQSNMFSLPDFNFPSTQFPAFGR